MKALSHKTWDTFSVNTFKTVKDIKNMVKNIPDHVEVEVQWYDSDPCDRGDPTFELVEYFYTKLK
jgi:hypothetical protein